MQNPTVPWRTTVGLEMDVTHLKLLRQRAKHIAPCPGSQPFLADRAPTGLRYPSKYRESRRGHFTGIRFPTP